MSLAKRKIGPQQKDHPWGLALSEFVSTLPGSEDMSDLELLEAFRAAQDPNPDRD
jgi:hypothetical protein